MECKARVYADTTSCKACNMQWDTNDPNPPTCGQVIKGREKVLQMLINYEVGSSWIVPFIPPWIADHSVIAGYYVKKARRKYRRCLNILGDIK